MSTWAMSAWACGAAFEMCLQLCQIFDLALPAAEERGVTREIVCPMATLAAPAFGAEGLLDRYDQLAAPRDAAIGDFVWPQREMPRQFGLFCGLGIAG